MHKLVAKDTRVTVLGDTSVVWGEDEMLDKGTALEQNPETQVGSSRMR